MWLVIVAFLYGAAHGFVLFGLGQSVWLSPEQWTVALTFGLLIVGCIQAFVFWIQAQRLRQTISKMDEIARAQGSDMKASIAEASRAAGAMEKVAEAVASTARSSADSVETTKQNWARQMRAYLSIVTGACVPQDRGTGWKYEVRMFIRNTGNTPAHAVTFACRLQVLPFPLSREVDLTLPIERNDEAGHIGPQQQHFIRAWLDQMLSDQEIEEFSTGNTKKLTVYGTVYYRDVFGNQYHTNFCQFALWDVKGNFSTLNAPRHNDAT